MGAPDLSFSVSHAGRRALVALLRGGGRVGVDLEVHRPGRNFTAIAAACFPPDTARRLFGRLESPEFLADFYDEWTRYEAATKVAGGSILYPEGIPRGPGLEFRTLPVWPGHSAALCLRY